MGKEVFALMLIMVAIRINSRLVFNWDRRINLKRIVDGNEYVIESKESAEKRKIKWWIIYFIVVFIFLFTYKIDNTIKITSDQLKIEGHRGTDLYIKYINRVDLLDEMPKPTIAVKGSKSFGVERGEYRLDDESFAEIYIANKEGPFIRIMAERRVIYINYKDKLKTKQTYNQIVKKLNIKSK